jgi:hypothetical protein
MVNYARNDEGATTFNYDVRLNFDTSFTGKDLLRTTLRAGNFADSAFGDAVAGGAPNSLTSSGLNNLEVAFQQSCGGGDNPVDCGDVVAINRLFYQFPVGDNVTVTVGAKVRQDDMLAMWPSVYPADTVLDIFTYGGAPGTYNLNLGAGAGVWYEKDGFSVSLNYVSNNADRGNPADGGIGTAGAAQTFTAQLGYAGDNYGLAFAYNYSNGVGSGNGTPLNSFLSSNAGSTNSFGVSGYWQPSTSGWVPSISTGWGINGMNGQDDAFGFDGPQSQSWYVGLQWDDAFIKGNALGMAVGQPTFVTRYRDNSSLTPNDGNYAWEWWYKFQVTDNISVTPAIFYLSQYMGEVGKGELTGGGKSITNFGGIIKTTFKF